MSSTSFALEPGYELHWYKIERILGKGAFGVTYLAHDINLEREVAIKEYLPDQFSQRTADLTVKPTSNEHKEDFEWGLKRFISEARILTKFEHPNLVKVFNVFEMNNTAYMVMNYEVGNSLQQILINKKTLHESELKKILFPLMDGLEMMHAKGFVHRDIKPGNIFIRGDGSPVLLDFGSARQTRISTERDSTDNPKTLTTLVSPGFAPIEQYGSKSDRQGPWTDIYGLGATLYRAVTGTMPVSATDRGEAIVHDIRDPYIPISTNSSLKDRYSHGFLVAIDHAMAFKAQDRPQHINAWRDDFGNDAISTEKEAKQTEYVSTVKLDAPVEETPDLPTEEIPETIPLDIEGDTIPAKPKHAKKFINNTHLLIAAAFVLLIVGNILFFVNDQEQTSTTIIPAENQASTSAAETDSTLTINQETLEASLTTNETEEKNDITQKHIEELLNLAQEDIDALRLTSPKENNAFDKYLSILQLDENNTDAKEGIQLISDKYVSLAYNAMNSNKFDHANSYLDKAVAITPNSEKITLAKQALEEKRYSKGTADTPQPQTSATEPEESNDSFWDKVKAWREEEIEKSKQVQKPEGETVDDRVKKAFGD